jgi:hypothetical protein
MKHSKQTKAKLSKARKGELNPFYGKHHSDETKRKMAERTRLFNLTSRKYELSKQSIRIPPEPGLSYLAGVVDADGSIRFRRGRPFVSVYNGCDDLMRWLVKRVGGQYKAGDLRGRVPNCTWSISAARDVYALCKALLPRLLVKQSDARAAMVALESKYGKRNLNRMDGI